MGLSGISFSEPPLILVVLLLVFGSKKLPGIASDLGGAIRDFRRALSSSKPAALDQAGTTRDAHPRSHRDPPGAV